MRTVVSGMPRHCAVSLTLISSTLRDTNARRTAFRAALHGPQAKEESRDQLCGVVSFGGAASGCLLALGHKPM